MGDAFEVERCPNKSAGPGPSMPGLRGGGHLDGRRKQGEDEKLFVLTRGDGGTKVAAAQVR